jgi:hypothetical protein
MPTMKREVLSEILVAAKGVDTKSGSFEVGEGHHVTFYVGQPGQAMVIGDVAGGKLADGFVELMTRETKTTTYLDYEAIHGVAVRPPKEEEKRRAGFA